jgi:hypothetical protein
MCCWPLPAQSFSGPSPLGLQTIFYCLTFEASLFVASYDSQGHGGGIRPRLHTGMLRLFWKSRYIAAARTAQNTKFYFKNRCVTYQPVRENPVPTVARRGRHSKHSLIYCCVLDRVYLAVAWQRVYQICYNIFSLLLTSTGRCLVS